LNAEWGPGPADKKRFCLLPTAYRYRANKHRASVPLPSNMTKKTNIVVSVERVNFQSATHTKKQQAWRYGIFL
jgi:hypothetical protein